MPTAHLEFPSSLCLLLELLHIFFSALGLLAKSFTYQLEAIEESLYSKPEQYVLEAFLGPLHQGLCEVSEFEDFALSVLVG